MNQAIFGNIRLDKALSKFCKTVVLSVDDFIQAPNTYPDGGVISRDLIILTPQQIKNLYNLVVHPSNSKNFKNRNRNAQHIEDLKASITKGVKPNLDPSIILVNDDLTYSDIARGHTLETLFQLVNHPSLLVKEFPIYIHLVCDTQNNRQIINNNDNEDNLPKLARSNKHSLDMALKDYDMLSTLKSDKNGNEYRDTYTPAVTALNLLYKATHNKSSSGNAPKMALGEEMENPETQKAMELARPYIQKIETDYKESEWDYLKSNFTSLLASIAVQNDTTKLYENFMNELLDTNYPVFNSTHTSFSFDDKFPIITAFMRAIHNNSYVSRILTSHSGTELDFYTYVMVNLYALYVKYGSKYEITICDVINIPDIIYAPNNKNVGALRDHLIMKYKRFDEILVK